MAQYVYSEKAQAVLSFMQANNGTDLMANDIAKATGIETKSITGVLNGLQSKELIRREEKEGYPKKVVVLTEKGMNVDPHEEKPEEE
jgi:DNA-binding MarR family transcriptional regulator